MRNLSYSDSMYSIFILKLFPLNLGHNGTSNNNWQSYAQRTVTLSAHMQTYSFTLTSISQDLNAVLDFNMGNAGNSPVTIDEIYLSRNP